MTVSKQMVVPILIKDGGTVQALGTYEEMKATLSVHADREYLELICISPETHKKYPVLILNQPRMIFMVVGEYETDVDDGEGTAPGGDEITQVQAPNAVGELEISL